MLMLITASRCLHSVHSCVFLLLPQPEHGPDPHHGPRPTPHTAQKTELLLVTKLVTTFLEMKILPWRLPCVMDFAIKVPSELFRELMALSISTRITSRGVSLVFC